MPPHPLPQIQRASGTLRFPHRKGAFLTVNIVVLILAPAVVLVVLSQLRALFRTLRDRTGSDYPCDVIAEVFQAGTRLDEDQSLTV
jgi:hypothetical protein